MPYKPEWQNGNKRLRVKTKKVNFLKQCVSQQSPKSMGMTDISMMSDLYQSDLA